MTEDDGDILITEEEASKLTSELLDGWKTTIRERGKERGSGGMIPIRAILSEMTDEMYAEYRESLRMADRAEFKFLMWGTFVESISSQLSK